MFSRLKLDDKISLLGRVHLASMVGLCRNH